MNPDSDIVSAGIGKCLESIRSREPQLRAFREILSGKAMEQARRLDQLPTAQHGPLHGIPYALKEVFDAKDALCEWGSKLYHQRRAKTDCAVANRLREAGAVLTGITTSSEFALSTPPETTNPFDADRTPGASSSGSAAAVGAGLIPFAIGSQSIGSCIRPAAYCGCYGFKPTIGSISLQGVMPLTETLDTCGLFASSVNHIREVFKVLHDSSSTTGQSKNDAITPTQIVVVPPWFEEPVGANTSDCVSGAADGLKEFGYSVSKRPLPALVDSEEDCLMTILCREFAAHHRKDIENSAHLVSDRVLEFTERGIKTAQKDYLAALELRQAMIAAVESFIPEDGVILTSATLDVAPLRKQGTGSRAPQRLWTLLGLPCISIPMGYAGGLPTAVQIAGRQGSDLNLLAVAQQLEKIALG